MPGGEQGDRALVTRVGAAFVDALVQLGCGGENQRQKKSTDKSGRAERMPGGRFASDETQPHGARLCFLLRSWASTICRRRRSESFFDIFAGLK